MMRRKPHQPTSTRKQEGQSLSTMCLALLLAWLWAPSSAAAASLYRIDPRYGTIEFSVGILGMFDVKGSFPRFEGELLLDTVHPEQSRIDMAIEANAVEMPLPDQVDLLRSAAYFDTVQYPTEHFVSTSIQALTPSHYLIHGYTSNPWRRAAPRHRCSLGRPSFGYGAWERICRFRRHVSDQTLSVRYGGGPYDGLRHCEPPDSYSPDR